MTRTFASSTSPKIATNPATTQRWGTNDLYIDNSGNLAIVSDVDGDPEAILQTCEHAAKTILGEMVLDTERGLPNFQLIWNGVPNPLQWEAALQVALEAVVGVVQVETIEITTPTSSDGLSRILNYVATIETIYGMGAINGGI